MMTYVRNIARHELKSNVLEAKDNRLHVVDFWAPWCAPCKQMEPILEGLARKYENKIDFYKINVDDEQGMTQLFNIRSVPTTILFRAGKEVNRFVGSVSPSTLESAIYQ